MNDHKLIKKIFNLSYYDLSNNFTNWFSITGLLAVMVSLLFCGFCCITSDYSVSYWGWLPNIFFDWISKFCIFSVEGPSYYLLWTTNLVLFSASIILPLVVIQNALDLAFDSSMSGFSLYELAFSYVGAMMLFNIFLMLLMELIIGAAVFIMLYFMQMSYSMDAFGVKIFMAVVSCCILYFMQLSYLLAMHLLEYRKGIWQSCKDLLGMVVGKTLFLSKVLLLQCSIATSIVLFLYLFLGRVIKILLPIIFWFFERLQLRIEPVFVTMMYNFFYVWAYILLYAWICLVTAHVYRQLICPPIDNPACSSCTSYEK